MPVKSKKRGPKITKRGPKRTAAQMDLDKVFIEKLALEGYTCREIAEELAKHRNYTISYVQVHNDLMKMRKDWRAEASELIEDRVAKMLRRFDKQRKELNAAWKRSQKMFESRRTKADAEGTSLEWTREERDGNVAFQNALSDIEHQERELLGLDKPKKTALTDAEGKESFQPLVLLNLDEKDLPKARKDNKT